MTHRHNWFYPNSIWEGRQDHDEVAVARYCKCGAKQMAYSGPWRPIPASHPDVRELCERGVREVSGDGTPRQRMEYV